MSETCENCGELASADSSDKISKTLRRRQCTCKKCGIFFVDVTFSHWKIPPNISNNAEFLINNILNSLSDREQKNIISNIQAKKQCFT